MILKKTGSLSNNPMPKRKRESSSEPSSLPTVITGFESAIEYVKIKRGQPLETLTASERESLFLTEKVFSKNTSP